MTTRLCNLAAYRSLTGETESTDSVARSLLDASSTAVLSFLNRELAYGNRKQWITLDGQSDCRDVFLAEWPVRRVRLLAGCSDLSMLRYAGSAYDMPTVEATTDRLVLMSFTAGEQLETILDYATYPTWSDLSTAIATVTGWSADARPEWATYPSRLIKTVQGEASQGIMLEAAAPLGNRYRLVDARRLELDGSLGNIVYVDYDGGYAIPEDEAEESSSSSDTSPAVDASVPELPGDIQMVVANIARDLYVVGKTSGGVEFREQIADYSYAIGPGKVQVDGLVKRYGEMLQKYKNAWAGV